MQVFISTEPTAQPEYEYYRPLLLADGNAYVGYKGQTHNDLCWEFDIGPIKLDREGLMFGEEIVWRGGIEYDADGMPSMSQEEVDTEPEPGINKAILDALGSDPDFKFSGWNSRMRIQ